MKMKELIKRLNNNEIFMLNNREKKGFIFKSNKDINFKDNPHIEWRVGVIEINEIKLCSVMATINERELFYTFLPLNILSQLTLENTSNVDIVMNGNVKSFTIDSQEIKSGISDILKEEGSGEVQIKDDIFLNQVENILQEYSINDIWNELGDS